MKRNIYMVQVSDSYGENIKSAYLPYAAGILISNAMHDETVRESYSFQEFVFIREEPDNVVDRLKSPFVVGFSNYLWNTEYNKVLAQKIKEKFPHCYIIFGGHNITPDSEFLVDNDYIDFLIFGEGELPFHRILLELTSDNPNFADVESVAYRKGSNVMMNPVGRPAELTAASPYLEGYFDCLVEEHPELRFSAILETSRGCPYKCAYCDWGALKSKVRQYPTQQALREIDWFSEHRIEYVWGADANFGIFKRDKEIIEYFVRKKQETGYPQKIRVNYAKSNCDNVFEITELLNKNFASKYGATLSFQSMSDDVLKIIGRENIKPKVFRDLLHRYNSMNMRTYSELILGLPGETYKSFCYGVGELLRDGQHDGIEYYRCVLLPNSELGSKNFIEKYSIKFARCATVQPHVSELTPVTNEYSNIVVGSSTMDLDDWVHSNQFITIVQALHCNGLLRFFAIYLYATQNLNYEDFYNSFLAYFTCAERKDYFIATVLNALDGHNRRIAQQGVIGELVVKEINHINWLPDEFVFLNYIYMSDVFYKEADEFLKTFNISKEIYDDLFTYQKEIMRLPFISDKDIYLNHDLPHFFADFYKNAAASIIQTDCRVKIRNTKTFKDWNEFSREVVWYERFGGSTMYKNYECSYNG